MAAGRFRADLFYRLNVYPITVPGLKDRREDIPLLVNHFVREFAERLGKTVDQVPAAVLEELQLYDWPGNVRELRNLIERAVILSNDGVLRLPERLLVMAYAAAGGAGDDGSTPSQMQTLENVERRYIQSVLEKTGWRISGPKGTAAILGLNSSTLRFRIRKLGIRRPS